MLSKVFKGMWSLEDYQNDIEEAKCKFVGAEKGVAVREIV